MLIPPAVFDPRPDPATDGDSVHSNGAESTRSLIHRRTALRAAYESQAREGQTQARPGKNHINKPGQTSLRPLGTSAHSRKPLIPVSTGDHPSPLASNPCSASDYELDLSVTPAETPKIRISSDGPGPAMPPKIKLATRAAIGESEAAIPHKAVPKPRKKRWAPTSPAAQPALHTSSDEHGPPTPNKPKLKKKLSRRTFLTTSATIPELRITSSAPATPKFKERSDKQSASISRPSLGRRSNSFNISRLLPTFAADARCIPALPALPEVIPSPARPARPVGYTRTKAIMDMDRIMIDLKSQFKIGETTEPPTLSTLPLELRNRIYQFVLIQDHIIMVCVCVSCADKEILQPPLTQVCRQMRQETLPIFYGQNRFLFPDTHRHGDGLNMWLKAIGFYNRSLLKQLETRTYTMDSAIVDYGLLGLELAKSPRTVSIVKADRKHDQLRWLTFKGIKCEGDSSESATVEDDDDSSVKSTATSILWTENIWDSTGTLQPQSVLPSRKETHHSHRLSSRDIIETMIASLTSD